MKKISINTKEKYDVLIGKNILGELGSYTLEIFAPCKLCIITDDTVNLLYGDSVFDILSNSGFDVYRYSFSPGEVSKSLDTYGKCLEFLAEKKFSRTDGIIGLGGGVAGDLTGFIASTYLRGIKYIQVPTTLLAAVDSSVGGKTGINLSQGKNLAGTFWQPSLVFCDTTTFKTLSDEIFLDGVAEAIKYGIILNKNLFEKIYTDAPITASYDKLEDIIYSCIKLKADLVTEDERDTGIRQLLNLGHTFGHAIEKCSNYTISVQGHGKYPTYQVIMNPAITVSGVENEALKWQYEYYVNQIREMDLFIKDLTETLAKYDEKVVLVMYGDHLPALEMKASDMKSGSLYQTEYVIWSNFGMQKKDENLTSYQLGAEVLDRLGIHEGTLTRFHQTNKDPLTYKNELQTLEYDMLYGSKFVYSGVSPFMPTNMKMGVRPITISKVVEIMGKFYLKGENFTEYSKVSLGKDVLKTIYLSPTVLGLLEEVKPADVSKMKVSQVEKNKEEILSTTE